MMEGFREKQRKEMAGLRLQQRSVLRDSGRQIGASTTFNIHSEADMQKIAKMIPLKRDLTPETLIAVKNGLLRSESLIHAFMQVDAALPALLHLFSSSGVDARLQLLAAHCICNLALGDEKDCLRLAKMTGPYLVLRMEGMNALLAEASVWAVGNMSSFSSVAEVLRAQGAYCHVTKLLSDRANDAVRSAAVYCLIHVFFHNHAIFTTAEHEEFSKRCLSKPVIDADAMSLFLCSLLSHNRSAIHLMTEMGRHFEALTRLEKETQSEIEDPTVALSLVRILGNMVTEASGHVATQLLLSATLQETSRRLLLLHDSPLRRETCWVLANLAHHQMAEVRKLCSEVGLLSWFPSDS